MDATAMTKIFGEPGPFVSVYLDLDLRAGGRGEAAQESILLRWRELASQARAAGADEATLEALGACVRAHRPGDATLAAVASRGHVLLDEMLVGRHEGDAVTAGALPSLLPIFAWSRSRLPYLLVAVDRAGADLEGYAIDPDPVLEQSIAGDNDEIARRSGPGGFSQPRYQHRVEDSWDRNAAQIASVVVAAVGRIKPHLVLLSGDVRARQHLIEHLPSAVRALVQTLDSEGGRAADGSAERRRAEVRARVADAARAEEDALLSSLEARADVVVSGVAPTLSALRAGQVATLLVEDRVDDTRSAWFAGPATEVAAGRAMLDGDGTPAQGRLVDVAVRAALGGDAAVHVLASGRLPYTADGLGALLRYPTGDSSQRAR
jgi:hypothetical protein